MRGAMTGNRRSSLTTYAMYLLKDKAGYAAVLYAQCGKRLRLPAPAGAARCLGLIQCDTVQDAVLAASMAVINGLSTSHPGNPAQDQHAGPTA